MKVVIVNCFDTYEERVGLIYDFFKRKNYEVKIIQSNYKHFGKVKYNKTNNDYIMVDTIAYRKNLSIKRLLSHYNFSKKAFEIVEKIKPDVLFTLIPPNSLTKFSGKYKINNPEVKLIFDLIDLWPETMPLEKFKETFPFLAWKGLRNKNLKFADFIITECDLYREILRHELRGMKVETLYLAKKGIEVDRDINLITEEIHLAYLGSVNNIVGIDEIIGVINKLKQIKPVVLNIIGDGENKQKLIIEAKANGSIVVDHGKIYNPQIKQEIFDRCHFGLNIMKSTVCVGLTMKSVDYFQHGLPIINNIPADTQRLVDKYNVGINIEKGISPNIIKEYYENDKIIQKRESIAEVFFLELFSVEAFNKKLDEIFLCLYKDE